VVAAAPPEQVLASVPVERERAVPAARVLVQAVQAPVELEPELVVPAQALELAERVLAVQVPAVQVPAVAREELVVAALVVVAEPELRSSRA